MDKSAINNYRPMAMPVAGLSLFLMLFVLVSGGAQPPSSGTSPDSRIVSELLHPVVAVQSEKLRVESLFAGSSIESGPDNDMPDWLPGDQPITGAGTIQPVLVTGIRCDAASCRRFSRLLPRAPPLA